LVENPIRTALWRSSQHAHQRENGWIAADNYGRNIVYRSFRQLKQWRGLATRYDTHWIIKSGRHPQRHDRLASTIARSLDRSIARSLDRSTIARQSLDNRSTIVRHA
jgi:transposase